MAEQACRVSGEEEYGESKSISICCMHLAYELQPPLFVNFNFDMAPEFRCLLVGASVSGEVSLQGDFTAEHVILELKELLL